MLLYGNPLTYCSLGYNSYTSVTRVVDGGEPSEFKSLFKGWKEKDQVGAFGKTYTSKTINDAKSGLI